jgi:hypothetical protein
MVPTVCNGLTDEERAAGLLDIVESISPIELILDPSTDQSSAFNWLVFIDPAQVCPDEVLNVTQRYTLSMIYFATSGDDWLVCNGPDAPDVKPCGTGGNRTRFMTGANICRWYLNECAGENLVSLTLGTYVFTHVC